MTVERRHITGFSNPTVKALRALREKKHRKAAGRFLAEGLRLLTDARECGKVPEILVMATGREPHPLLDALEDAVDKAGGDIVEMDVDILAKTNAQAKVLYDLIKLLGSAHKNRASDRFIDHRLYRTNDRFILRI